MDKATIDNAMKAWAPILRPESPMALNLFARALLVATPGASGKPSYFESGKTQLEIFGYEDNPQNRRTLRNYHKTLTRAKAFVVTQRGGGGKSPRYDINLRPVDPNEDEDPEEVAELPP